MPAEPLTKHQVAQLVAGFIGSLVSTGTPVETIRQAMTRWGPCSLLWDDLQKVIEHLEEA